MIDRALGLVVGFWLAGCASPSQPPGVASGPPLAEPTPPRKPTPSAAPVPDTPPAATSEEDPAPSTLHAIPTNSELPPPDAYFAERDSDRRRPRGGALVVFYEDGNVERFRGSWSLRCKLDALGIRDAKAAIVASGLTKAKSEPRDPSIKDGGSLAQFYRLDGATGEVRNPNHPVKHIEAMRRASRALDEVLLRACPR